MSSVDESTSPAPASAQGGNELERLLARGCPWLRYPQPLENEFRQHYAEAFVTHRRTAIVVGAVVATVVGILDFFVMTDIWWDIFVLRHIVGGSLLLTALGFSRSQHFIRYQQTTVVAILTIVAAVVMTMIGIGPPGTGILYFSGLLLLALFGGVLVRLHFWNALASIILIGIWYNGLILWVRPQIIEVVVAHNLFYIGGGALALTANYYLEQAARNDFLQHRLLRLKQLDLEKANARLQDLASQDGLTGLANRAHFDEVLLKEWLRARRSGIPITLLLGDVDHFKQFNDTYGHQAGDACLIKVGEVLRSIAKRPSDLVARYGGEEFAVILAMTDTAAAHQLARDICSQLESSAIPHVRSSTAPVVTMSIGCATFTPNTDTTPEQLIHEADMALYQAKADGRNQVCSNPTKEHAAQNATVTPFKKPAAQ